MYTRNFVLSSDLWKVFVVNWRVPFWTDVSFFLVGEMLWITFLSVLVPIMKLMKADSFWKKNFPGFHYVLGFI